MIGSLYDTLCFDHAVEGEKGEGIAKIGKGGGGTVKGMLEVVVRALLTLMWLNLSALGLAYGTPAKSSSALAHKRSSLSAISLSFPPLFLLLFVLTIHYRSIRIRTLNL